MSARSDTDLRSAVRRLTVQFTALIVVLLLLVGGLVYAIVSHNLGEAAGQSWHDSRPFDSPLVQEAIEQRESQEELTRLLWALIVSGLVASVASAFAAAWMARRAIRPMAQALELQRRFVADASHELRTPLTLLSTRAQLVRRRLPTIEPEEARTRLASGIDEIVQDAQALTDILEDLLIAADPRETDAPTAIDLAACADEAVAALTPQADARSLTLSRTGVEGGAMVLGSTASFRRLFSALIANSLDHARSTVAVDVALSTSGKDALIRVQDDGPGFPPEIVDRAFERFSSSRSAGTHPAEDAGHQRHYGIGLALVSEIATRFGGAVWIESAGTEAGATVAVRFPVHTGQ